MFELHFHVEAMREWEKLDNSVRLELKKKLQKRLDSPIVPGQQLKGDLAACYKIRSDRTGFRLIYKVEENALTVIAIGKRADLRAYGLAAARI